MTDSEMMDYKIKVDELCELANEKHRDEFFKENPSPELIADVVQELFEYGNEDHIQITFQAIQRGVITDMRKHPGRLHSMTLAQIWESTLYAQVLRSAGWTCPEDSDPNGQSLLARLKG